MANDEDAKRKISACLLDYGNTIVEFDRGHTSGILRKLGEHLSVEVEPVEFDKLDEEMRFVCALPYQKGAAAFREHSPHEQMSVLLSRSYGREFAEDDAVVIAANEELQRLFVESILIDTEVRDFLRELSGRLPIGVVSNYACGDALRRSLEDVGILDLFRVVVVSGDDDIGYIKPHDAPFEAALKRIDCDPAEVLFVGDRWDADMLGASWQGMMTCHHVGYTSDTDLDERYESYSPDFRIQHLRELDNLLG